MSSDALEDRPRTSGLEEPYLPTTTAAPYLHERGQEPVERATVLDRVRKTT